MMTLVTKISEFTDSDTFSYTRGSWKDTQLKYFKDINAITTTTTTTADNATTITTNNATVTSTNIAAAVNVTTATNYY
jgi:hypothetical protein